MVSLLGAAVFFLGIHLFVAGTGLRDRLVAAIGERPYQGAFSLASIAGLVWLAWAYGEAPYIETWGQLYFLRHLASLVMLIAFLFAVMGLTTPNPTAVGGESLLDSEEPAKGIVRVTRHPFLWGALLWAAIHLVINGDVASLIFFGTFVALTAFGTRSIDAKRKRALGEKWDPFAAKTSNIPFAAIASGRNSLKLGEISWWRPVAGVVVFFGLFYAHEYLFGVSPV